LRYFKLVTPLQFLCHLEKTRVAMTETQGSVPTNEMLSLEFNFECGILDVDQFPLPESYLSASSPLPEDEKHEPIHCPDILVAPESAPMDTSDLTAPATSEPVTAPILLPKGWRKMAIGDLRNLCRELSLSSEGTKAEIVQRLSNTQ
jgi:hypothetical protein